MQQELNTRVLVVDDEELVRDSVRSILCPERVKYDDLQAASTQLFGDSRPVAAKRSIDSLVVELDEAQSGREALAMVQRAVDRQKPYALILLDMRMPGWDGLTTAQEIRKIDRKVEIAFVTAYSDHAIQDVIARAGPDVGYLCKPFMVEEIHQLVIKAIYDWNRLRNLEGLIRIVSGLRITDGQLDALLHNIFDQAVMWLGAHSAMLLSFEDATEPRIRFSTGSLQQRDFARACIERMQPRFGTGEPSQDQDLIYFPFEQCALVVHEQDEIPLSSERVYLFRLFLEHSSQAVQNARLHQALITQEKLSALGQAMGYVIHDLRSPIGVITSSVELARDEPDVSPAMDELLGMIEEAADSAIGIVNDLLEFARGVRLQKRPCTLGELMSRLQRSMRHRLGSGEANLHVDGAREAELFCDSRKMHRALENLVANALDAVRAAGVTTPTVRVNAVADGDLVSFAIHDNGPGIPEDMRGRLFEPFATSGKAGGTGLGLAIVQQIVEAHGGRIRVESSSRGTSFTLEIPRSLAAEPTG